LKCNPDIAAFYCGNFGWDQEKKAKKRPDQRSEEKDDRIAKFQAHLTRCLIQNTYGIHPVVKSMHNMKFLVAI